jgi:hypothetical protein
MNTPVNKNVTVNKIVIDSFCTAFKNIPSILGAAILWILTCWIPYINVGTTIALLYGLPLELSQGKIMKPTAIFDARYRKYMGEFFSCVGLMLISIIPAFFFMVIPAIIISIGWSFAILLLIDKELNPAQALTESTKYTYGYKWTIFLAELVIGLLLLAVSTILYSVAGAIGSTVTLIMHLLIYLITVCLGVASTGVLYKMLVVERNTPLPSDVH